MKLFQYLIAMLVLITQCHPVKNEDVKNSEYEQIYIEIEKNDIDAVRKRVLADKKILSYINRCGSPLHHAARKGSFEIVKILVELGADIRIQDSHSSTPLFSAVADRRYDMVRYFLLKGSDPNGTNGNAFLLDKATQNNDLKMMKLLLEFGADVNYVASVDKNNALHTAVTGNHLELVKFLIDQKINVNQVNVMGTPLFYAVETNNLEIVKELLKAGADIHLKSAYKGSARENAKDWKRAEVLKLFSEYSKYSL